MPSSGLYRLGQTLAIALLLTVSAAGHAAQVTVLIDGAAYPGELRDNTELLNRLHVERSAHARHFEGELSGVEASWIRVSNIRGRWQGVVSLDGRPYVINSSPHHDNSGELVLEALSPSASGTTGRCATDSAEMSVESLASTLSAGAEAATLAQVCQTTVDGVCLLAELDIAFDLLFQQRYGSNAQAQGIALLNIVDGYYRTQLNIQFDALSMTFLANDLFDPTTDATALLTDIQNKKNAGQVPFVTNPRAILHLVTGRDFDMSTVGIANVNTLCSPINNTGTTQIVSNDTGLTALVIAHEIGHNFGASHDGVAPNTCALGFIMSATLSPNANQFSSCSITEMTTKINSISNLAMCFEYPVDASLVARAGNPTSAGANENFTLDYDLTETHASVASTELDVSGSLAGVAGTFVSASVSGAACAVAANAQTFTCVAGNSGGLLDVVARASASGALAVTAKVVANATGGVKDINAANDSVTQTVTAAVPPAAPSALTATPSPARIDLAWQDNSNNESGFRIERRVGTGAWAQIATTGANVASFSDSAGLSSGVIYEYHVAAFGSGGTSTPSASASAQLTAAPASSGGGGGGGGSFGIELAPLLLILALRRRSPGA